MASNPFGTQSFATQAAFNDLSLFDADSTATGLTFQDFPASQTDSYLQFTDFSQVHEYMRCAVRKAPSMPMLGADI